MITGLPPYVPSQLQTVRCPCSSLYLVYCGGNEEAAGAKERAGARGARFVDSRREPFTLCECARVLDFTPEDSLMTH